MTIFPKTLSRGFYIAILIILAGVVFCMVLPMLPIGAPFGYWDAKRDISRGYLAMKVSMWDRGWQQQWKKNVKEKYNIEIGGRTPSSFNQSGPGSYDHAYNAVQRAEIIRIFGRDVVREEMMDALERKSEYANSKE